MRFAELKQKLKLPIRLDTIVSKYRRTMFGNMYWGEDNYRFFDNSIQYTLLVYKLMRQVGGYGRELQKTRNYFLEKRRDGKWRNTYESSLILETILPDMLVQNDLHKPASLTLSGTKTTTTASFPFSTEIEAGRKITVNKTGSLPVYLTAYQQQWNSRPLKVETDFVISTSFQRNEQSVNRLKSGEAVTLAAKVLVKADANYVMIEIPIPAGCSYKDKPQPRLHSEVHREYFKNKVSIFCSSLPKGEYTFSIPLLARYTGSYQLNPAKVEMMYFPVFYGRESMKKVTVY